MYITITTTQTKLTKSLVNQMPLANTTVMEQGKVLGKLLNVRQGFTSVALIEYRGNYYILPLTVRCTENGLIARVTKGRTLVEWKTFENECEKDQWLDVYKRVARDCINAQIYI